MAGIARAAEPTVLQSCPAGQSSLALWRGQIWQQEVRATTTGQLAAIALTFVGPVAPGAHVRLRRGGAPSAEAPVVERTIEVPAGRHEVRIDTNAGGIALTEGDLLVVEIEGSTPEGAGQGALVGGVSDTGGCRQSLAQNGSKDGVSPDLHVAYAATFCPGECPAAAATNPAVTITKLDEPATDPSRSTAIAVDPRPPPDQRPHMDEGMTPVPRHTKRRLAAAVAIDLGFQAVHVELDGARTGLGGVAGFRGFGNADTDGLTFHALGAGTLGGQTTGLSSRVVGDASAGFALELAPAVHLVLRGGIEIDSYQDDELEVSVITFPLITGGLRITTDDVFVELAPRGGTTLRAVYAPGDESAGRRHFRPSRVALSWGGAGIVAVPFGYLEGSVARVEEQAGLWLERASACAFFASSGGPTACAWGQAWHGPVIADDGTRDVTSLAGGLSIGFGDIAD